MKGATVGSADEAHGALVVLVVVALPATLEDHVVGEVGGTLRARPIGDVLAQVRYQPHLFGIHQQVTLGRRGDVGARFECLLCQVTAGIRHGRGVGNAVAVISGDLLIALAPGALDLGSCAQVNQGVLDTTDPVAGEDHTTLEAGANCHAALGFSHFKTAKIMSGQLPNHIWAQVLQDLQCQCGAFGAQRRPADAEGNFLGHWVSSDENQ